MFRYGFILLMMATCCSCLPAEIGRQRRIMPGGMSYSEGEYKFHVSLWFTGDKPEVFKDAVSDHLCSGTLVDQQWAITTAFCVSGQYNDTTKWKAYTKIYKQSEPGTPTDIVEIIIHPEYNKFFDFHKDIALLKLATPVEDFEPGAANNDSQCPTSGETLHAIGWGETKNEVVSNLPQKSALLNLMDIKTCDEYFNECDVLDKFDAVELKADKSTLCAVSSRGGRIGGSGDAGAPLVANCNGKDVVVGIASYGYEDCEPNNCPTLFTKLSDFSDWITEVTSENDS